MDRRSFVATLSGTPFALTANAIPVVREANRDIIGQLCDEIAGDESYWRRIRQAFALDVNHINLNSGSVSPAPRVVADAMSRYWTLTNMSPSYYVDELLYPEVEVIRRRLAAIADCSAEEIALTRNTSESLQTVQFGLTLRRGDEIVSTTQDYPRMINAWQQRARRDGVVLKLVQFPTPPPSMSSLYDRIFSAVTSRTKVLLICHMTYTTGQIFPVRQICEEARRRGIITLVDGGHTFAQFPFSVSLLGCDVYASSLHKWLCAPVGNGLLYVRKSMIPQIWPLLAAPQSLDNDIRKFEAIGTYPLALRAAVGDSLDFHAEIGAERKAARLGYLRERWMRGVEQIPGVTLRTSFDPTHACAIGAMSLAAYSAQQLTDELHRRWRIHVRPRFVEGEFDCIRITPNVFSTTDEIDLFVEAIRTLAGAR